MRTKIFQPLIIVLLCLFLTGCPPEMVGVFVNSTDTPVHLTLTQRFEGKYGSGHIIDEFQLGAWQGHKTELADCVTVRAICADGAVWFVQEGVLLRDLARYSNEPRSYKILFLVDRDGYYPVPLLFRENWADHIGEIKKEKSEWVPCKW